MLRSNGISIKLIRRGAIHSIHFRSQLNPVLRPRSFNSTSRLSGFDLGISVLKNSLPKALLRLANMQITVQMLDGSITPFRVRSSITIASLKAKFEPWQPMRGRALLHHDVRLDDRVTLNSVPGIKNGTILRVDKHVSQVKNKTTGKKTVMSGPASSAVDEDVVESVETSGEEEEISTEDERRISSSKRKRPSTTSAAAAEDSIDDDSIANPLRAKSLLPGESRDNPLNIIDTELSTSEVELRIVKKEKRDNIAREQAVTLEAPIFDHTLRSLENNITPPQETAAGNATASNYMPRNTAAISFHPSQFGDDHGTLLAGINAAAANETERLPLQLVTGPDQDISTRQCNACGRACGCDGVLRTTSNSVLPPKDRSQNQETAPTNSTINSRPLAKRNPTSQRTESIWTAM